MSDFIFKISPNIVLSSYGVTRLGQYAHEYGSKFVVVLDPILREISVADKIMQSLKDSNVDFFVADTIADGATTEAIANVLSLARQGHIHGVIAAGGGKALHVGQVVAALYNEKKDIYAYVDGDVPTTAPLPLICMSTTLRDVFIYTQYAPVIDSRKYHLKIIKTQDALCKLSLSDPTLLAVLADNQKTAMSIECLCLDGEAYLSQKASPFSDMLAEKSIELLLRALNGEPSLETVTPLEELLAQGGFMASLAVASSAPGVCSLLSMAFNARFKISSSLVAAILFPYFIEDAEKYKIGHIEKLAQMFSVVPEEATGKSVAQTFAENIRMRLAKRNLPARLKELGVPLDQLSLVAEDVGQLSLMSSLSRSMTSEDLFAMLKAAY